MSRSLKKILFEDSFDAESPLPSSRETVFDNLCISSSISPLGQSNFVDSGVGFEDVDDSPISMSSPVAHLQYVNGMDEEYTSAEEIATAFSTLLRAPIINSSSPNFDKPLEVKTPTSERLSSNFNRLNLHACHKRQSIDTDESTPVQKRRRRLDLSVRSRSLELPPLQRCHSETVDTIKSALDRVAEDDNMISDGSKTFCLPTIPGKHQDLKSITPEILTKVLNQEYDDVIEQFVVVDCRYNYEYEGGHIQGARNYNTKDGIMENLIHRSIRAKDNQKRIVLIFHCEFSSERGPKMLRFLRAMDRDCNKECYPDLFYPEMYLLHGGYKNFFEHQQELCSPQTYMPMHHEDYKEDLRKCRIKSKSWAGETSRSSLRRGLKF